MNDLDLKINEFFGGLVVRKDLVKEVKGNAIVPTFVLEYLLGQYCASAFNPNPDVLSVLIKAGGKNECEGKGWKDRF